MAKMLYYQIIKIFFSIAEWAVRWSDGYRSQHEITQIRADRAHHQPGVPSAPSKAGYPVTCCCTREKGETAAKCWCYPAPREGETSLDIPSFQPHTSQEDNTQAPPTTPCRCSEAWRSPRSEARPSRPLAPHAGRSGTPCEDEKEDDQHRWRTWTVLHLQTALWRHKVSAM